MSEPYEAGIRPQRLEFVREDTDGVTPSDPEFIRFSDNARTLEPVINPQAEQQIGLGNADPIDHLTAIEQHQITIAYDLQQFLIDGSDNPLDALYDAVMRDNNNAIPNSHTIVRRMDQYGIAAKDTVAGSSGSSKDTRKYYVARGAKANATISADPTNSQPDLVELEYEAEKGRLYQIDQPDNEILTVHNDGTESVDVTLENEDASTSETVTVAGGSSQDTTETGWTDLDAVELSTDIDGNVRVVDSNGDDLFIAYGSDQYGHDEGDLGVPTIGSGSHASAIGSEYSVYHSGEVTRGGSALADNVAGLELSVTNNWATPPMSEGGRRAIVAQTRNTAIEATVFGVSEEYDRAVNMLQSTQEDFQWEFVSYGGTSLGTLQIDDAQNVELSASEEAGQGVKQSEVTINGHGVTLNPA